jgi:hypothetical protein
MMKLMDQAREPVENSPQNGFRRSRRSMDFDGNYVRVPEYDSMIACRRSSESHRTSPVTLFGQHENLSGFVLYVLLIQLKQSI